MTLDTQASIQGNQTANPVPSGLSQHMKMTESGEAVLSFGVSDIQDISMNSAGALVIKFSQGSGMETLEISDFKSMAGKQACIKLADGAEIDSHVLYDDLCNQNGICTIEKPQAGATLDVLLQGDKKYDLKFDLADGKEIFHEKQAAGEKLILTFTDGAKIVFQTAADIIKAAFEGQTPEGVQIASLKEAGSSEFLSALEVIEKLALRMKILEQQYADSEGTSPEVEAELAAVQSELADQLSNLEPASGEEGTTDDILGSREIICEEPQGAQKHAANEAGEDDLASKLAEIVPAAGESGAAGGISGGGYGFQSQFSARPVGPIDDVGPIDPTALQYGIDHRRDDVFPRDEAEPETPPIIPPDDKPEIAGDAKTVDETDGFALSTSGILNFDFGDDGAGDIAPDGSIAVSGSLTGGALQSGGHVVTIVATALGYEGTANGQSVFTLVIDPATRIYTYTQTLPFDHADGNDANDVITLDFGVRIADSDGDIAQSTITINVLDDAPSCISSDLKWIDESDMSPMASVAGQFRADFGNDGAGAFSGNGAVPAAGLTSQGESVNVVYDPVTGSYIGATATSTIFILQINGNGSYEFNLLGTLDHPDASNPNDYLRLEFGVRATDFDGDSIDGTLTIKVLDDGPKAEDDFFAVDKSVGTITGNILTNDDFSADDDNTVTQVTFGGHSVTVDPVNGANINGSHGTLHIAADGSYTYTLFSGTKSTDDRFGYTLTDGDGDSSQAKILFEATNGVPSISGAKSLVDETNGFALSTSGTLNFDFGDDGAGNIAPDGHFTASGSLSGGILSSGGHGVTVVTVGGGYAGIANGQAVFTLMIDSATGAYTYTQLRPFDHADGNNANDIIMLDFGVRIADSDGDTAQASIKIKIADDAPHSIDSQLKWVDESDMSPTVSVSGQLRADFGNDGAGAFSGNGTVPATSLTSNGENVRIVYDAATGTYTGSTSAGTVFVLTINGNGSYAFNLLGTLDHPDASNPNDYLRLDFGVRATDFDGDSVDGTLTIKVLDDGPKAEDDCFTVDKSIGTISGNILSNDDFSADDDNTVTQVSFNGHTVTVDPVAGAVVSGNHGILNIAADGSYTYTMYAGQKTTNDIFKYTLTDGDGDSSLAKIQFESISGKLIVGKNVDDVDPSKVPHHIGGDDGTIVGTGASDILVGDVGGATLEQKDQDYNFSFILDISGSMGSTKDAKSKISLLKAAVANLLNELGGYDDGDIKVHFTPFSTTTGKTGTFMVTESDGLDGALEYIDALSTGGYTNYEAPMQDAINWLKGNEPLGGNAINTTYFISDGEPNRYLNNAGNVVEGNVNTVIGQITGSDGTNEVADLKALNDEVIGVGINVSNEISRLNVIDSDGQAINVKNPADLDAVLQSTNPVNRLAEVGDDVLQGGDGNDIIYGDSVNTDVLAANEGLAMPQGSGWRVFDTLESVDPNWSRDDTENYIRSHSDELAEESTDSSGDGRQGGDDNISGGGGNDTMFGQEGNDTLYGGAGNDIISGGSGADAFLFRAISEGIDIIRDFDTQEGDVLDFSGLIQGFDPAQQAINDFVFAREENGGTIISVDTSGSGNLANAFDLVALEGVQGVDIQTMFQNGNINLF